MSDEIVLVGLEYRIRIMLQLFHVQMAEFEIISKRIFTWTVYDGQYYLENNVLFKD